MAKLKIQERFGITPNHLLNDPRISWKAKGIYGYLQSKPEDWEFAVSRFCKDSADGEKSTISGIKELEKFGYLIRNKYQNSRGHWEVEYVLIEKPVAENRKAENPPAENPVTENRQINKKRITKQEEVINNIILPNGNIEQSSDFSDLGNFEESKNETQEEASVVNDAFHRSSVGVAEIKEDKRDPDIQLIIDTIKELNGGITDDTRDKIRISARNLKLKIDKMIGFNGDYSGFLIALHRGCNDFYKEKFGSVEGVYWNLSKIIANVKANIQKQDTPKNKVTFG